MKWITYSDSSKPTAEGEYLIRFSKFDWRGHPSDYQVAWFNPHKKPWIQPTLTRLNKNLGWSWELEVIEPYEVEISHYCHIEKPEGVEE